GRAAQHDHPAILPFQIGRYAVVPHVRVHGDGVGVVALEGLAGILFGGRANVATFRIEHQRQGRVVAANVPAQRLELVFGAFGGKVGNLRLETTYIGRRGIDNGTAEFEDGVGA